MIIDKIENIIQTHEVNPYNEVENKSDKYYKLLDTIYF